MVRAHCLAYMLKGGGRGGCNMLRWSYHSHHYWYSYKFYLSSILTDSETVISILSQLALGTLVSWVMFQAGDVLVHVCIVMRVVSTE